MSDSTFLGLTANGWAALAGWVTAIGAIVAIIVQVRRERLSRGVDIVARLDEDFTSPRFREVRRCAARFFRGESATGLENDARELLGFFEKLAFLYKKKVVEASVVWHFFGSWILPYYHVSRSFIAGLQKDDPNVFRDFDELYEAVHRVEERERNYQGAGIFSTADYQRSFLERESQQSAR